MKKYKMGIIAGAGLIVLLLGISAVRSNNPESDKKVEALWTTVERGSLTIHVQASGDIKALRMQRVVPKIKSKTTISFLVDEGSRVEEGELVATLDSEGVQNVIDDLEKAILNQEILVSEATADLAIQKMSNVTNLMQAEGAVKAAEMEKAKWDAADKAMNIRQNELILKTAQSDMTRSKRRLKDLEDLFKEGFITEDEVEEGLINLETFEVAVETAKLEQKIMKEFAIPLKVLELDNQMSKVSTNLKKTTTESQSLLSAKTRKHQIAVQNLEESKEKLAERKEQLLAHKVYSPSAGVIKYGDSSHRYNRYKVDIGQPYNPGLVLLTIPDLSEVKAKVDVPEADIHQVKVGQTVTLKVDAVPGQLFEGEVLKVAEVANQGSFWRSSGVKEFEVEIKIHEDEGLKPGYSCEAEIVTDALDDALQLPVQAVFNEEGNFFVFIKQGSKTEKVPVEIGRSSITHVEILTGVVEGDQVYLTRPVTRK